MDKPLSDPQKLYIESKIASLVDSAPNDLDTLGKIPSYIKTEPIFSELITGIISEF